MVLAVVSLLMIWSQPPAAWYRTLASVAFAVALVLGVTIVVGKTRTGRMVLTRRRWKYGLLIGIVVVFTVVAIFFNRPGGNPALALFPFFIGVFIAQLFEPEAVAAYTMATLTERDVAAWKRVLRVTAIVGVVLCCISLVAAVAGNLTLVALALPFGIVALVFVAVILVRFRATKRQAKGAP
ncbi:hypothetical protein [Arthrobacter sp. TWP1-1]|uniref:hypothetical protein n=1 Tax=Arthrobacter sp. TWP1-1 TaxID=2804568 RepID=UPI003CEC143B